MSLSLKTSAKIGKGLVWLRYMMPLICLIAMVVMCSLPLFSLNNRDDEENKKQSVFTLAAVSAENSKSTLQKKGLEDVDYDLYKSCIGCRFTVIQGIMQEHYGLDIDTPEVRARNEQEKRDQRKSNGNKFRKQEKDA